MFLLNIIQMNWKSDITTSNNILDFEVMEFNRKSYFLYYSSKLSRSYLWKFWRFCSCAHNFPLIFCSEVFKFSTWFKNKCSCLRIAQSHYYCSKTLWIVFCISTF